MNGSPLAYAFPPAPGQPPDPGRALTGGKGAGLILLAGLGLPVPPGFVITTAAGRRQDGDRLGADLVAAIGREIGRLGERTGRRFGAGPDPLTVSVRSGAPVSMPGMLDTVLDVGRDPDPLSELHSAVLWVLRSWHGERAVAYRRLRGLDDTSGTAVVVQAMVDGTADGFSGTGVLFTRDPVSGAPGPVGEFLAGAQGPDLVGGSRTPQPLETLREARPAIHSDLVAAGVLLDRTTGGACEIEFTVERDTLWLLQVRAAGAAGRTAPVGTTEAGRTDAVSGSGELLCRGLPGAPGVAAGRIVLDLDAAEEFTGRGEPVILVRPTTDPADLPAMALAAGLLTAAGGRTSHAAVVARELGVPCVCGAGSLRIDLDRRMVRFAGRELPEGTLISIDGGSAAVWTGR